MIEGHLHIDYTMDESTGKMEARVDAECNTTLLAVVLAQLNGKDVLDGMLRACLEALRMRDKRERSEAYAGKTEEIDIAAIARGAKDAAHQEAIAALERHLEEAQEKVQARIEHLEKRVLEKTSAVEAAVLEKTNAVDAARKELEQMRRDAAEKAEKAAAEAKAAREELERVKAEAAKTAAPVTPPEVQAELERLRSQAARTNAESELRAAFDGLKASHERLLGKLSDAVDEDAETAGKYKAAFGKALRMMADKVEG